MKTVKILGGVFLVMLVLSLLAPARPEPELAAPQSATPVAPKPGVTLANYLRLDTGMSYADVVAILGKSGTEMSSNEIAGTRTVMYQWEGRSSGANMNAMFQNDKMIQKAQFGLK